MRKASRFIRSFPWLGFALQAPQALYSLTGYGLVLGSVMGFATDLLWTPIRAAQSLFGGPGIKFRGPPPNDPIGKAARYLSQPPYHYAHAQSLSYQDHWMLLLADVAATQIIIQNFPASILDDREPTLATSAIIQWEPWREETRGVLLEEGWNPDENQSQPLDGLREGATFLETLQAISAAMPLWLEAARLDFPASQSTASFAQLMSDAGEEVFTWANGGEPNLTPQYFPEEMVIARCFEYRIFPPHQVSTQQVDWFISRSIELAAAFGKNLPGPREMKEAAQEAWGGFITG